MVARDATQTRAYVSGVATVKKLFSVGPATAAGVAGAMLVGLFVLTASAASTVDVYDFATPEQEARYRGLIAELRCPKCMNTNIAGSDAPIAKDLRSAVHEMILAGQTDTEILQFMQSRYGDFVLYDPPFNQRTWLFWILPVAVALILVAALWRIVLNASQTRRESLAPDDQAALDVLLAQQSDAQDSDRA